MIYRKGKVARSTSSVLRMKVELSISCRKSNGKVPFDPILFSSYDFPPKDFVVADFMFALLIGI